jgi:formate dehydrogenase beta subunit
MGISRRTALKGLFTAGAAAVATAPVAAARPRHAPDANAIGILYDNSRCIGCRACVAACRDANGLAPEARYINGVAYDAPVDLDAHTKTVIKLYDDKSTHAFVKTQCMHCVDPACVSVCMIGALHKEAGGIVAYDKDKCIGCRYCEVACPFNVPKFEWSKAAPRIVKCELCKERLAAGKGPACVDACPRQAIVFGKRDDLLKDAKARIAGSPDTYIPKVYGEHDGGGTQMLYLSSVPFERLGFPALGEDPVPELSETLQHAINQGFAAPLALYGALAVVMFRNRKNAPPDDGWSEVGR